MTVAASWIGMCSNSICPIKTILERERKKRRETRPTILGEGGYGEYNKRRESKKKKNECKVSIRIKETISQELNIKATQ